MGLAHRGGGIFLCSMSCVELFHRPMSCEGETHNPMGDVEVSHSPLSDLGCLLKSPEQCGESYCPPSPVGLSDRATKGVEVPWFLLFFMNTAVRIRELCVCFWEFYLYGSAGQRVAGAVTFLALN